MDWVDLNGATPLRAGWYAAITRWRTQSGRIPTACWWSGTKWGLADPTRIACFFPQPFDRAHDAVSKAFDLEETGVETPLRTSSLAAAAG
ncbi:hypothetical protein [Enterovirga rhinocerotis]|uniref:Uncharacterized protein n=1 Tax=Enterovirga rhinocerotis TaxID=1339210 RepID=A0A4R7BKG3_9HYPH|nr:hypothetical protein [Enterovirga rhinocerotis]TDR85523.1 hypothetical protein EV668_4646 [Enterovirga rhinocerotis]